MAIAHDRLSTIGFCLFRILSSVGESMVGTKHVSYLMCYGRGANGTSGSARFLVLLIGCIYRC